MYKTITAFKQINYRQSPYMGVNRYDETLDLPVRSFMFTDLRECLFDDLDLSRVEFFGCLLDGASFRGATLHGARFIGCFSSDEGTPTDFRDTCSVWQNTLALNSHLNYLSDQDIAGFNSWPPLVVKAAKATLSPRNDVRYEAVKRLEALGSPEVAPYLATLLADEEWEVRLVALKALTKLRRDSFSYRDQALMKQIFLSLGDEEAIVQDMATQLIQTLKPDDEILRFTVSRMTAPSSQEQLAGLRAATELCELDQDYSRLFSLDTLHQLLSDESPLVREESLHLLQILSDPSTEAWILACISDESASVREQAIRTIGWLDFLEEADEIEHLLHDPDADVRLQTLYTLEESDLLEPTHLSLALADSSPRVRRAARKMEVVS